jgi:CBS domain-containing protein
MEDDAVNEEFSIMYEESEKVKVLDSNTFKKPIKNIKVGKPICLDDDATVQDVLSMMQIKQFGCVLITKDQQLVGILTERDIVTKVVGSGQDPSEVSVKEVMTPNPEAFQPDDSIAFVMNAMVVGGYRHVPVVDESGIPIAVVSIKDIIAFIVEHFSQEVLNLPPKPLRNVKTQDGG